MAGYTRQSASEIVNGQDITAPPLSAEFNKLASAFDGATGHTHTGATGDAAKVPLATSVSGYLPAVNGGSGGKNNLSSTVNPVVGNDSTEGYSTGSVWENTSTGRMFFCVGNAIGAAVWRELVAYDDATTSITPRTNDLFDLGEPSTRFQDVYLSGGVAAQGNSDFDGNVTVDGTINANGTIIASGGVTGNITGNTTGTHTGPLDGSLQANVTYAKSIWPIAGFGSSLGTPSSGGVSYIWDNIYGTNIYGDTTGTHTGNVTGDVTGNVVGTLNGHLANSETLSKSIIPWPTGTHDLGSTDYPYGSVHANNVVGDLNGDLTKAVTSSGSIVPTQVGNFALGSTDYPYGTVHSSYFRGVQATVNKLKNHSGDGVYIEGNPYDANGDFDILLGYNTHFAMGGVKCTTIKLQYATGNNGGSYTGFYGYVGTGGTDWVETEYMNFRGRDAKLELKSASVHLTGNLYGQDHFLDGTTFYKLDTDTYSAGGYVPNLEGGNQTSFKEVTNNTSTGFDIRPPNWGTLISENLWANFVLHIIVTNGATAGAITFTGSTSTSGGDGPFTIDKVVGASALTQTEGDQFLIRMTRIASKTLVEVIPLQ